MVIWLHLKKYAWLCEKYNAALIVDEAHATGIIGEKGEGLVQQLELQRKCFARVHTFGKACGCHGAIILGSAQLKKYLYQFCKDIYLQHGASSFSRRRNCLILQDFSSYG